MTPPTLLVATRSAHKLKEIRQILPASVQLVSLDDIGFPPHPDEDGIEAFDTFEANALAKAEWFAAKTGLDTVSDDSGLVVDALGGAPGVWSKRFAPVPPGTSGAKQDTSGAEQDAANNRHLLERLTGVPPEARTARYVCVVALVRAGERTGGGDGAPHDSARATGEPSPILLRGEAEGVILDAPRGAGGFGYDPLFFDPELGRTFAELTAVEKAARSHRGRAFSALVQHLQNDLLETDR
jgi:XTP/dITP diphosphohydrolase